MAVSFENKEVFESFNENIGHRVDSAKSLPYLRVQTNNSKQYEMPETSHPYATPQINVRLIGGHIDDDTFIGIFRWRNNRNRISLMHPDENNNCPTVRPVHIKSIIAEQEAHIESGHSILMPFTPFDILYRGLIMGPEGIDDKENAFYHALIENGKFPYYRHTMYISDGGVIPHTSFSAYVYLAAFRGAPDTKGVFKYSDIGPLTRIRILANHLHDTTIINVSAKQV